MTTRETIYLVIRKARRRWHHDVQLRRRVPKPREGELAVQVELAFDEELLTRPPITASLVIEKRHTIPAAVKLAPVLQS